MPGQIIGNIRLIQGDAMPDRVVIAVSTAAADAAAVAAAALDAGDEDAIVMLTLDEARQNHHQLAQAIAVLEAASAGT